MGMVRIWLGGIGWVPKIPTAAYTIKRIAAAMAFLDRYVDSNPFLYHIVTEDDILVAHVTPKVPDVYEFV